MPPRVKELISGSFPELGIRKKASMRQLLVNVNQYYYITREVLMARSRVKTEYRKAITLLKSYVCKSPSNPFYTLLEQEIQDRIEEIEYPYVTGDLNATFKSQNDKRDFLAERLVFAKENDRQLNRLYHRQKIISEAIEETPSDLWVVIKEVYIFERWTIEREGVAALFKNKEAVYRDVRRWFEEFEDRFY